MKYEKELQQLELQNNSLYNAIAELRKKMESEDSNSEDIDVERLETYARQKEFVGHGIELLDADVAYKYCVLLAGAVDLLKDKEKRIKQYYFILRLYYANGNNEILEDLLRDSRIIDVSDMEWLKQSLSEKMQIVFLVDLLLLISLDGTVEEVQLEYWSEQIAFYGKDKNVAAALCQAVKAIIQQKEEELYKVAYCVPLHFIKSYVKTKPEGEVITSLEEIPQTEGKVVTVYDATVTGTEVLLDEYGKEKIIFRACAFTDIARMNAYDTEIIFDGCEFKDCKNDDTLDEYDKKKYYVMFCFNHARFDGCIFKNCIINNMVDVSIMLRIYEGYIQNTIFDNCKIQMKCFTNFEKPEAYTMYGALVYTQGELGKCKFSVCSIEGAKRSGFMPVALIGSKKMPELQIMNIIYCKNSKVCNSNFERCEVHADQVSMWNKNYLLNIVSSSEKNNTMLDCIADENVGTENWRIDWL